MTHDHRHHLRRPVHRRVHSLPPQPAENAHRPRTDRADTAGHRGCDVGRDTIKKTKIIIITMAMKLTLLIILHLF